MRLLHIDTGRHMRGGQWQVLNLCEGLARAGCDSLLLAPRKSPLLELARSRQIDAMSLTIAALPRIARAMDILHVHDARAHTLAALSFHRRLLVSRRVAFPIQRNRFSEWKYRRVQRFLAVSEHVKGILAAGGVDPGKISVVYDGVLLGDLRIASDRIVAPATSDPMKGSALLSQAAALGGFDVQFSEELSSDLNRASLFVYITHQEGLGSAILLAMAAGVPVVASRTGGIPEIVQDGVTGILTDNTPEAIAEAVSRVLGDAALASRLAAAARSRVEERFSLERMVRDTMQIYEEVMSC